MNRRRQRALKAALAREFFGGETPPKEKLRRARKLRAQHLRTTNGTGSAEASRRAFEGVDLSHKHTIQDPRINRVLPDYADKFPDDLAHGHSALDRLQGDELRAQTARLENRHHQLQTLTGGRLR